MDLKSSLGATWSKSGECTWNGPCGKSKMEPNYIITKINNQPISSAKDCILKFTELKGEVVVFF